MESKLGLVGVKSSIGYAGIKLEKTGSDPRVGPGIEWVTTGLVRVSAGYAGDREGSSGGSRRELSVRQVGRERRERLQEEEAAAKRMVRQEEDDDDGGIWFKGDQGLRVLFPLILGSGRSHNYTLLCRHSS